LLESGLAFPEPRAKGPPLADFDEWLGGAGVLSAAVFVHPAVLARARSIADSKPGSANPQSAIRNPQSSDGLEWPIRLAAAWQQVRTTPIRLTQANTLFKRDLGRLQTDPVLAAPL